MNTVLFLTPAEAVDIHNDQVARYGGEDGIRDLGLLESALAMPCSMFDDKYLHEGLYEMAAAYLYHICRNHPFVDGNKRTALACALVFLDMNGVILEDPDGVLYELTIGTVSEPRQRRWA